MKTIATDHQTPHKQCEYGLDPITTHHNGETVNFHEKWELWTTDTHCLCHSASEFKDRIDERVAEITAYPVNKGWKRVNSKDGKCYAIVRVWRDDQPTACV